MPGRWVIIGLDFDLENVHDIFHVQKAATPQSWCAVWCLPLALEPRVRLNLCM
eukprot:CAMPEP_0168384118 /NCGR_PEP_ID=MMETSP0228-20121227/14247_1 /TAXON_ID=133427 /ORGANISM="Protoceratium reticulatum, Strain CCCM 535 (=CCMP 1889)" /LENGTH=52 /DNA_ID=CAMNT_0008397277 /DNA_START=1 /DNA_END=156 /DNA_ORIENTATION=+